MEPNESLVLTVEETARLLRISRGSAYAAVAEGRLPVIRLGRRLLVSRPALERMLAEVSGAGTGPGGAT